MGELGSTPDKGSGSLADDLWGGLAAMLVALPAAIAFGVLVATSVGPEHAGEGALAGMIGAAALGVVAPLAGRTAGLISAPCAPAAAVLSALAVGLAGGVVGRPLAADAIFPLMALTTLLAAGLQIAIGLAGGGRLITYIPYPVVSGYLSGVAVLIAVSQLPRLLGVPADRPLWSALLTPSDWSWQGVTVGLATIVGVVVAPRLTRRAPAVILGLAGGVVAYAALAVFDPALRSARGNPLVIGPLAASGPLLTAATARFEALLAIELVDLRVIVVPTLTLAVLLSIDTLKTCVVLDAQTRSRHDSNRELIGQGLGNLASCLAGGLPGAGVMGPTMVNLASGGRSVRSGVAAGALALLALAFLGQLIAWVPIAALAAILLVVAWRMFDRSVLRLLRFPGTRLDVAVVAGVVVVAVAVDLIAAALVGVGLAILLFVRDQVRGSVVHRHRYLGEVSSKTRRRRDERAALARLGRGALLCELRGNLFFGTTDQLFSELEPELQSARYVLLDLRRVQSVDYTAAHLFEQLGERLRERGGQLLVSGLPSSMPSRQDIERYLAQLGLVAGGEILVAETLDGGLEWMEERLLAEAGIARQHDESALALAELDLFRALDRVTLARLADAGHDLAVDAGAVIFAEGDEGDQLFLVRQGSVRILLDLAGGKRHHLATIAAGDFFGELSFLDDRRRSASAEAKEPTRLFAISRARFGALAAADPALGHHVMLELARTVSNRLRQTDLELRALEER